MAKLLAFVVVGAVFSAALPGAITSAAAREAAPPKPMLAIDGKTRICLNQEAVTGSILARRICKTQAQWQAAGVDVTKLIAQQR